jgi:hypothetical protein
MPHPIGHHPPQSSHVRIRVLVIQWCSWTPTRTNQRRSICVAFSISMEGQRHQKELQLYSSVPWEELKGDLLQRDNYSYYRCTSSGIYIIKKFIFCFIPIKFMQLATNLMKYWLSWYYFAPYNAQPWFFFFPHEASPIQVNGNTGVWFNKRTERNKLTSPAYLISSSETDSYQE